MKNLLKLTFLTVALSAGSTIFAQEVKKDAAAQTPSKSTATPSKDAKAPAGGSKMAINEQGVPSKTTKTKAAAAPAAVDPAKKKDAK